MFNAITDVDGILAGHYTDAANATGCTVIICPPEGAVGGVDVRGPAPATRETDLLHSGHLVERVNAVLLTGGSAFGLDAASGVMRFLEERGIGYDTGAARVPIVPAAAIFDLAVGRAVPSVSLKGSSNVRPTADAGYAACASAASGKVKEGRVGAGTGATVGHMLGPDSTSPGGVGTASQQIGEGVIVAALVVVNAFGDVVDPKTGRIIAGTRLPHSGGKGEADAPFDGARWLDSANAIKHQPAQTFPGRTHTTIGVIATNAALTKEEANLVAMMAHDGLARAIRPAHALYDGDALFVLSAGRQAGNLTAIGHTAAEVVAEAIVRAVR